ncbi:MAG: hypothetical protein HYY18_18315 [Planctomycetes bacterium]|nr:hypothetical protein [Planctomycetota bacterium]
MIDPLGLAFPVAPLDDLLLRLPVGSAFDAVVQAKTGEGRYRLSVSGMTIELETAVVFAPRERVRLAVKSAAPLTLELSRPPAGPARGEAPAAAPERTLAPELETAVRQFAAARPAEPRAAEAARFLAERGLGVDPRAAAGALSLAARPGGAAPLLERAVAALEPAAPALRTLPARPPARGLVEMLVRALGGEMVVQVEEAVRAVRAAAAETLASVPELAALDRRLAVAPEAEAEAAEAAAVRRHPLAGPLRTALEAARELGDRALAVRVLNGEAAARGESPQLLDLVWVRHGRFESAFARVERREAGSAGEAAGEGVVVTVDLSRLGAVRAALGVAAGLATVAITAASGKSRRELERRKQGLVEALVRLGMRAEVRISEGPVEAVLPLAGGGLDVRA